MTRILVALALSGGIAQAQDLCRNGLFADDQAELRAGRISNEEGAYFYQDSTAGCPQKGNECRQPATATPGGEVLVSKVRNGFACVWQSHNAVGWIPAARVTLSPAGSPQISEWAGDWKFFDNRLEVQVVNGGRLVVKGRAFWHGIGATHEGSVAGETAPTGNHATVRAEGCELHLTLAGGRLAASDNRGCGGANVTFGGVYERAHPPFEARSASTLQYGSNADGQETVDITNVAYELAQTGNDRRLILRKTHTESNVIDDIGNDGKTTVEAWPLGVNVKEKPLYRIALDGEGAEAFDNALLVFERSRGPGWWSVYHLNSGEHFFETNAPVLSFSITEGEQTERYAGLEIASDDSHDSRLKGRGAVGMLTYASGDRVIREVFLSCDNEERAADLRSLADTSFEVAAVGRAIRLTLTPFDPTGRATAAVITIPVLNDDLDLAHAQVPAGMRATASRR